MTGLADVERRARRLIGQVEETTVPTVRRQDLETWAAVTHDAGLLERLRDPTPVAATGMYLVGQMQLGAWPPREHLGADGLAPRDSPGVRPGDPVAVLHGGGRVELHAPVREGQPYLARREVVDVERKGRPGSEFLRVTAVTRFTASDGEPVVDYHQHIILREVSE